jgi:hypothetical protein
VTSPDGGKSVRSRWGLSGASRGSAGEFLRLWSQCRNLSVESLVLREIVPAHGHGHGLCEFVR